jgi:hypothetical protein
MAGILFPAPCITKSFGDNKMTEIDRRQPAATQASWARFRHGWRMIFVCVGVTAVFFCIAITAGYVDAVIALAAFLVLIGVVAFPRRVRLATVVLLTLLALILLWANLRPTGRQRLYGGTTPRAVDPITVGMFWRSWPLSPCMVSLFHDDGAQWALIVDGFVFVVILLATKAISERCLARWYPGKEKVAAPSGLEKETDAYFPMNAQKEDSRAPKVGHADRQNSRRRPYQFGLGSLLLYVTLSALFLATSRTLYLLASPGIFVLWVIVIGLPLFSIFLSGLVVLCSVVLDSLMPKPEEAAEERLPTSNLKGEHANIDEPQSPPEAT